MASTRGSSSQMPSNARQPKVYQIDFTAVAAGKRVASTKRRVRWRFGFANPEALASGQTGTACRGEEHDVTLVWSITSGKRLILADGQEVHYSNSRSGSFEFSWTMRGNHVLKLVAHASPPLSPTPGFRQYDFFVDGQSFFTFPKVYRLGLAQNDPRGAGSPSSPNTGGMMLAERGQRTGYGSRRHDSNNIASLEAPHNADEEEAYLQEAIKNSLQETAKKEKPPSSGASIGANAVGPHVNDPDLLIDFFEDTSVATGPPPGQPVLALPPSTNAFAQPPGVPPAALPPSTTGNGYAASPWNAPQQQPYGQQAIVPTAVQVGDGLLSPQPQPTPSTIGFGSPAPGSTFFQSPQQPGQPPAPATQDFSGQQPGFASPPAQGYATAPAPGAPAPYGQPPAPAADPFAQPPATAAAPSAPDQFAQPPASSSDPFAAPPTQDPNNPAGYSNGYPQPAPASFGQPAPADQSNQMGYPPQPAPDASAPAAPPPASEVPTATSDPAALTMNKLSGDPMNVFDTTNSTAGASGSLADQAYSKFANMDNFNLLSNKEETRANPFDSISTTNQNLSLSDIKSQNSKGGPAKEIMKSSASSAMVVSNQQQGNWGGVSSQYGAPPMNQQNQMGGLGMQQQQYMQPMQHNQFGQQPMGQQPMGQQPPLQQNQFGQPPMQQNQFGQSPMQQNQFGQPPMQQPQYGQSQYGQQTQGTQQGFY